MEEQYKKYQQIVRKITKNDDKADDLLHDVLLQLGQNKTYNTLSQKDQVFFFIRAAKNQFYSNNSLFQRTYNRYKYEEFNSAIEVKDDEYYETPSMEWVKQTLETELNLNKNFWYNYGIFNLYIEHKRIETIHQKTQIPKYSIRNTIKEMKVWLNKKWIDYQDGTN
jgi:hypothetical protein